MNSFGIDSLVQDKVNAYRGQPDKLAQSYQMSQQLVDLLALQKLKSEKEAAARDIQLQMAKQGGGSPPTIAQQREKEVLDMTRQELAKQVGGVGDQQQQEEQARMQQMMQAGIGSQGAPNLQGMAGGGIVAFSGGGYSGPTVEDLEEMARQAGLDLYNLPPGHELTRPLSQALARVQQSVGPAEAAPSGIASLGAGGPNQRGNSGDGSSVRPPTEGGRGTGVRTLPPPRMYADNVDPNQTGRGTGVHAPAARQRFGVRDPRAADSMDYTNGTVMGPTQPAQPQQPQPQPTPPTGGIPSADPNRTSNLFQQRFNDMSGVMNAAGTDSEARGNRLYADDAGVMNLRNKRRAAYEQNFNQMTDPKQESRDRLIGFLTGGGGHTSLGGTMSGAARGSQAVRDQYDQRRTAGLEALMQQAEGDVTRNDERQQNVAQFVTNAMNDTAQIAATAMNAAANQEHREYLAELESRAQTTQDPKALFEYLEFLKGELTAMKSKQDELGWFDSETDKDSVASSILQIETLMRNVQNALPGLYGIPTGRGPSGNLYEQQ